MNRYTDKQLDEWDCVDQGVGPLFEEIKHLYRLLDKAIEMAEYYSGSSYPVHADEFLEEVRK